MKHSIYARAILCCTESHVAKKIAQEIVDTLGYQLHLELCEPFTERDGMYDVTFTIEPHGTSSEELKIELISMTEKLKGKWHIENPIYSENGTVNQSVVLDNYEKPDGQLAWLNLWLHPKGDKKEDS